MQKQAMPLESAPLPPLAAYEQLVARRTITDDAAQREVLSRLQTLYEQLCARINSRGKLFARNKKNPIKGLYIWGNVGRGKSMVMDLFFNAVPLTAKRRVHFHAFMQEVHAGLHAIRQEQRHTREQGDPVMMFAHRLSTEVELLCFDELQATDPADATLIFRLFEFLFDAGITIVTTSNHPPASLYTGGVQRERFLPFIALIEERMDIAPLSSPEDYRHKQLQSREIVYFTPLGASADAFLADTLKHIAPGQHPRQETIEVQSRQVKIVFYNHTIGRASFQELCATALGPADYLAIAKTFDTLILTDIPILSPENRNEAKRFVTLIDALYEQRTKLVATAAAAPETLYPDGDGSFEFRRTVSRLKEMQSEKYLADDSTAAQHD